jgi:hydroxymethylpyrimidine pyrophosphatase-like HAD family hydrolase
LRAALEPTVLRPGHAFVQPGKEATMTLYPLDGTSLDDLVQIVSETVARAAPEFGVQRNVHGVELRPHGIDKGVGLERMSKLSGLLPAHMAGVGDSDPDLSFLRLCGFSAAPANASPAVQAAVTYVAQAPFGNGLIEVVRLIAKRNRDAV